jgi:hypothetical protein
MPRRAALVLLQTISLIQPRTDPSKLPLSCARLYRRRKTRRVSTLLRPRDGSIHSAGRVLLLPVFVFVRTQGPTGLFVAESSSRGSKHIQIYATLRDQTSVGLYSHSVHCAHWSSNARQVPSCGAKCSLVSGLYVASAPLIRETACGDRKISSLQHYTLLWIDAVPAALWLGAYPLLTRRDYRSTQSSFTMRPSVAPAGESRIECSRMQCKSVHDMPKKKHGERIWVSPTAPMSSRNEKSGRRCRKSESDSCFIRGSK